MQLCQTSILELSDDVSTSDWEKLVQYKAKKAKQPHKATELMRALSRKSFASRDDAEEARENDMSDDGEPRASSTPKKKKRKRAAPTQSPRRTPRVWTFAEAQVFAQHLIAYSPRWDTIERELNAVYCAKRQEASCSGFNPKERADIVNHCRFWRKKRSEIPAQLAKAP